MRARLLVVVLIATAPVTVVAAPQQPTVFITSSSKTDVPAKASEASSEAAAWAHAMELSTAEAIEAAYPCSTQTRAADVGDMLGHERMLQLLGAGGDPASCLRSRSSAGSAAHSPRVRVPWKGTVSITQVAKEHGVKPGEGPFDIESSLSVSCTLTQLRGKATCAVSYSSSLVGNGASVKSQAAGSATAYVTASFDNGKASVSVGAIRVPGGTQINLGGGGGGGPEDFNFGPWDASAPSSGDANHSSGSWTDGKTKIAWSFSRQ